MAIQINVDPNIDHLIKGFEKGTRQFNAKANKTKLKVDIDEKSFTRPLGRITGQANMFESAMEAANARVVAFGASTAVLASVVKAMKSLARTSVEVEQAFTDINRILGLTSAQFDKFGDQLFDTAQKTASSFKDAAAASLEFARQGLQTEDVLKRTSDALTLVRLTGMNAKKSVDLLTATVNAFTDLDTTSAVNKFVAVETKFAVAAKDLVEGLSRVGSSAIDAKVNFDELNAMITAVQQTTGRGGAVIGNALKTIFTRLQRESTLEALERFNVSVRDIQGNILPATRILDNFAATYGKLGDSSKAYLREQVAGVFQANILSSILKDLNKEQSTFSQALSASTKATNEAQDANEKLNQTLSSLLQNTGTELTKLQNRIGEQAFAPLAKTLVSSLKSALMGTNKLLDSESDGIGAFFAQGFLKGFGNVLQGPVLAGALKVLLNVGKQSFTFLSQAVPVLLNIVTETQKRAQTESFINNLLESDLKLSQQIINAEGNQAKQLELVLKRASAITQQYELQKRITSSLGGAIVSGGSYITSSGVKGSAVKNKAGGYTPSIRAEQNAIRNGVGGASSSSYPVVIPNFAFGGGRVGPVVANSSEVMVPNYGGSGGSAIFNQNMISKYGMPSGAVPIASKGLISRNKKVGRNFEQAVGKAIGVSPTYNSPIDFYSVPRKPVNKGFGPHLYRYNSMADAHAGLGHTASQIISKLLNEHHQNPKSNIKFGWDDAKKSFVLDSGLVEIIGAGKDRRGVVKRSNFNSLSARAKKRYSDLKGENFITKFNQDYVSLYSGYIPSFASGRDPLSKYASGAQISSAQKANPMLHGEDLVKVGFDNHIQLPIKSRARKGSGKANSSFGDAVEKEVAKNPKIKSMGYKLAHKDLYGAGNSAVDLIKVQNGLLKGVMEVKGGEVKPDTAFKPARAISENLDRPMVRGMFSGPPGEKVPYETHLVTNSRSNIKPQRMPGMMRRMAKGYVPNFAKGKGKIFDVSVSKTGGSLGGQKAKQYQATFEDIITNMSQAGYAAGDIKNKLISTAQSLGLTKETIKNLEPKFASLSNSASKSDVAGYMIANTLQETAKESKKQKTLMKRVTKQLNKPGVSFGLMMAAPMVAGFAEQAITGGKSRIDQTGNQRFWGGLASNAVSGASAGAMIAGPWGALIGGLAGLGKAAYDTSLSLGELKQKAEEYDKTTSEVKSSGEAYIQAQKDIASALTQDELSDAQKRAAEAMKKLQDSGSGLDSSFKDAGGSVVKMAEALSRYENKRIAGSLGSRFAATRSESGISGLAGEFVDEMVDPQLFSTKGYEKSALKAIQRIRSTQSNAGIGLQLDSLSQELGIDFDKIQAFKESSGFKNLPLQRKKDFIEQMLFNVADRKPTEKKGKTKEERELENFINIKDAVSLDVKRVRSSMSLRNMRKEYADTLSTLQDSMLEGLNAPIEQFKRFKSRTERDYAHKLKNSSEQFYADNAETYANAIGKVSKSQDALDILKEFESTLKSGGDISGFDERLKAALGDQEVFGEAKAFFDNFPLLVAENNKRLEALDLEKQVNNEKIRIEEIKANNTKAELDAQREIATLQAKRKIEDAKIQKQQADVNLALSRREFGLDMAVGLTGSQRARRSQSIAGARFRADISNLNAKEKRDLERSFQDEERAIAKARRETLGTTFVGSKNYPAAAEAFRKREKEIMDNATAERKEIELKATADRARFNEEYRQTNEKFLRDLQRRGPRGIGLGLKEGMGQVRDDLETFHHTISRDIPIQFRDGMVSAMEATLDKTKDLKGALTDLAMDFMRIMRRQALENIVGGAMSLGAMPFKKQQGGVIKAQNGMYISGNRTGDRNPAMLEDGEYVLNRNAVRALGGPSAIDRLNFGVAPRFKGGGAFLNRNISLTSSAGMSSKYFASDDPLLKEMRDAAIAADQRRQQKKAKKTALRNMIIQTAVSSAMSAASSAVQNRISANVGATNLSNLPKDQATAIKSEISLAGGKDAYAMQQGYASWSDLKQSGALLNPTMSSHQSGGYISNGPRNIDSIPTFMAGGEFVMNNRAVRKYGLGFMSRLNGGYIPGYQNGGSIAESSEKLGDSNSLNTNNISININMGGDQGTSVETSDGNQQKGSEDQKTNAKRMSERIKAVVLQVINEEQRSGGSLSKTKVAR